MHLQQREQTFPKKYIGLAQRFNPVTLLNKKAELTDTDALLATMTIDPTG